MNPAVEYDLLPLDATGDAALACWQAYDPANKVELQSAALRVGERLFFIDPIPLADEALEQLTADAKPAGIILTNANHARAAEKYRRHFSIGVYAHEEAVADLELAVDGVIPAAGGAVLEVFTAVPVPGAVAGEIALYYKGGGGLLIVGDALIHLPGHGFSFLPAKYCLNPRELRHSLRQLLTLPFETLAMAHGTPLVAGANARLAALLEGERS